MQIVRAQKPVVAVGVLFCLLASALIGVQLWNQEVEIDQTPYNRVLLIPDTETEYFTAQLVFPYGGAHPIAEEGLAHYTEHLAWHNIQNAAPEVQRGTFSNAWTSLHATGYHLRNTPDHLADTLRALNTAASPLQADATFAEQERDILLREYELYAAENPYYVPYQEMTRELYAEAPMARSIIGIPEDFLTFHPRDADTLHAGSHRLREATLAVYGNITPRALNTALQNIEPVREIAGTLETAPSLYPSLSVPYRTQAVTKTPDIAEDVLLYRRLWPLPECADFVRCTRLVRLAEDILGSTLPGGIGAPLRFEQFLTRSFSLELSIVGEDYLELSFVARPDTGVALAEILATFEATLHQTLDAGISEQTFTRIRDRQIKNLDLVTEKPQHDYHQAVASLMTGQQIFDWSDKRAALEQISLEEFNAFLSGMTTPARVVIRNILSLQKSR